MYSVACGLSMIVVLLTGQFACGQDGYGVRSLQMHGRHVCNAVQIAREVFMTPAACLSVSDPVGLELISTEGTPNMIRKSKCSVWKHQAHPKYVFLSHNLALMQVQCGRNYGEEQIIPPTLESKKWRRLILAGVNESLKKVYARVKVLECFVCEKEYGAFDCERQICFKPTGKDFKKLRTVEGLAGAGLFTQNAKLAGILSYGFANGSLVAERVIYYKQFLHRTLQEFKVQKE